MKNLVIILASALFISACSSTTTPVDSARIAWAVGNCAPADTGYASILKTTDGGATWSRQGVGQASLLGIDLADVKAIDAQHVWAVGTKSTIVHTTDGGATWMAVATPLTSQVGLLSIDIVNGTHIYVTGEKSTVLRSTNAGATWSLCDTTGFDGAMIQGVHAITADRVMICGGISVDNDVARGFNRITTNGGASWDSVAFPKNFNRHAMIGAYHYGSTLVFYGTTNYYVVSRDNGITWRADSTKVPGGAGGGADINHLIMLSENTWWASMDMGHILRTENAGSTWSDYVENLRGTFMLGIDAFDGNNAISVGETVGFPRTGPIARTTDGGATWTKVFSHDNALVHVSCVR
jgi:photosystem II stability/assembly factor-like uncharacterized protein